MNEPLVQPCDHGNLESELAWDGHCGICTLAALERLTRLELNMRECLREYESITAAELRGCHDELRRLRVDFAELQADYNESQQEIERLTRVRDGLINQMTANTDTATREFNRLYLEVQRLTHEETLRDDK